MRNQKLISTFLLGLLVLNYPLITLFDQPGLVGGIPVLYVSVFASWLGLILLTYGALRSTDDQDHV
ncbi:hypothetical protein ADIS_4694 [Lunatimonas lonarensis]|jgi:hypothetical protein|uniref:DUF3311 domain-containing protein n=1 Tax=Lunatimonas lonarensis TaxID=1232681 RepID=R7ZLB1_9BACT|nr:hypothetical protein [Lunatimonas lonarensis]EON74862.1 hypothetical protein ADIS_4694 [Lunatimonas lonarensis]